MFTRKRVHTCMKHRPDVLRMAYIGAVERIVREIVAHSEHEVSERALRARMAPCVTGICLDKDALFQCGNIAQIPAQQAPARSVASHRRP